MSASDLPTLPVRYAPLRELGRGGHAVVVLAFDHAAGRLCAVKLLEQERGASRGAVGRFIREAAVYRQLSHPNVLTLHDLGVHEGRPYLATDFAEAGSVAHHLEVRGRLPAATVAALGAFVADALDAAHAAGVIHRDVKPGNVLLSGRGVLLGDFGIAHTETAGLTRTGVSLGTLGYIAPEQLFDAKQLGPAADLYALGATLYDLASGRQARDLYVHPRDHIEEHVIEPGLADLVFRATRRRASDRPPSARAMAVELRALARALPAERPSLAQLLQGQPSGELPPTELATEQLAPPEHVSSGNTWSLDAPSPPLPPSVGRTITPRLKGLTPAGAPLRESGHLARWLRRPDDEP